MNHKIRVASIQENLQTTTTVLTGAMAKLAQRGTTIEVANEQAEFLEESSEAFYTAAMPGWKRYLKSWIPPEWWFRRLCHCCKKRKRIIDVEDL